jgi:hypothetical protein
MEDFKDLEKILKELGSDENLMSYLNSIKELKPNFDYCNVDRVEPSDFSECYSEEDLINKREEIKNQII